MSLVRYPFVCRSCAAAALVAVGAMCPSPALGHDSPEHVVEHLTELMKKNGPSAELLYRRACEYRALGKLDPAEHDLRDALEREPKHLASTVELSRILLAEKKTAEALEGVNSGLDKTRDPLILASLYMLRADIDMSQENFEAALADCESARAQGISDVDWYLKRSLAQARLGRGADQIAGLQEGFEKTGSVVLKAHWTEALIDNGQASRALELIERELADSRWRSSWLLRRGRARLALGQKSLADADLHEAIDEIAGRLSPRRPDPSLLADRGLAYALLGDHLAAQRDLRAAKAHKADSWMLQRLEAMSSVPRQSP